MKYIFLQSFLLFAYVSIAQTAYDKVSSATDSAFNVQNPNTSIQVLRGVDQYVNQVNDSLKVEFYLGLGTAYGMLGKADSSFYFLDEGEKILSENQNDYLLLKIYNVRGIVLMSSGEYEASLEAFQKCMDLGEGKETPEFVEALRKVYGNSGGIYFQMEDYEKAIEVTLKGKNLSKTSSSISGTAYNNLRLALAYNALDSLEKSISYLDSASLYLEQLGDTTTWIYAENTLGQVYRKQDNFEEAEPHLKKAYQLSISLGNIEERGLTTLSLSRNYLEMKDYTNAKRYASEALTFARQNNFPGSVKNAHDILYQVANRRNNLTDALYHRNQYVALADSLSGVEMKSRVAELETKYETEKEAEIARLSLENELQQANIRKSQIIQWTIIIVFIGSVIFTIIFINQRSKKQKAEREAQDLQIEALKKRFIELHASPSEMAVELDFEELNGKLNTPLTEREFECFKLSIEGKTNAEISEILFISVSTVKFHLRNTYSKMGVGNRKEAFQYMLKTS